MHTVFNIISLKDFNKNIFEVTLVVIFIAISQAL